MLPMEIGKILMDKYVLKILAYTSNTSRSIPEISMGLQIPIASCYRKVKALEKLGLIKCVGTKLTPDGKRVRVYQSNLEDVKIELANNKLRIRLKISEKSEDVTIDVLNP